ncbi:MAG: HAD-IA family hydrolase [Gemmatimonadetes bacterium]|nr:HAD-IA family hydrolase [Gemmatimonadota bacterium]
MVPKAVLFDAGNTLIWLDHPFIVQALREHGVETTIEGLMEAEYGAKLLLDELARAGGTDERTRGKMFFAEIFRRLGVKEAAFPPLAQRMFARHAEKNLWSNVRERTVETLDQLRRRGYRLGVISNADGRIDPLLESVGLRGHFEVVVDSGVVGIDKPDPRIFHLALEQMGVEPREAVYVGDIYEIDVQGARAAGMRAILIDPLWKWDDKDCERIRGIHDLLDVLPAQPA